MPSADFNYFGWEGVSFMKPADWDLSHVEGKAEKGYAVLDDGLKCRVQLRWQKTGREVDLEKFALRQEKALSKKDRKSEVKSRISDCKIKTFRGKKIKFESGAAETYYYMLQCGDCLQVIILGIFGVKGEKTEEICGRILSSLKDHAADGKIIWSVYGFSFKAPVELMLKEHQLRSGDLSFEFGRDRDKFVFHRVSLAGVLLKKKTLNSWVMDFIKRKHSSVSVDNVFEDSKFHANGVSARGREMSRFKLYKKRFFNGHFWVSGDSGSILGVVEMLSGADSRIDELVPGVGGH